jgi:hypothetical protein
MDVPGLDRAVKHKTAFNVDPMRDAYTPLLGPERLAKPMVEKEPDSGAVVQDPRRSSVSLIQLGNK